jgi:hypothetical protein
VTLAAYGLGMVSAAVLAPRLIRLLPFDVTIVIGPLSGLAASLVMMLTVWPPAMVLAALGFFLIGAGPVLWVISSTTLRQVVTPAAMLGRVSALITTATVGARPLGSAAAAAYGPNACIVLAAAGFGCSWRSSHPRLGRSSWFCHRPRQRRADLVPNSPPRRPCSNEG